MISKPLGRSYRPVGIVAYLLAALWASAASRILVPVPNVLDLAASPVGPRIYLATQNGSLLEVSTVDGLVQRSWTLRSAPTALDISTDGTVVAVGHALGTDLLHMVELVDTTGGPTRTASVSPLPGESGITGLRFAADGRLLILGGVTGTNQTRLRQLHPGAETADVIGPATAGSGFAEDPDRNGVTVFGSTYIRYQSGVGITAFGTPARQIQPGANVLAFEGGYLECGFNTNYLYSTDFRLLRSFTNPGITRSRSVVVLPGKSVVATLHGNGESLRLFDTTSWQPARSVALTEPGFNNLQQRRLLLLEGGTKVAATTRNAVELLGMDTAPFRAVSAHRRRGTNQVVVRFSTPFRPGPATNLANISLVGGSATRSTPHVEEQDMLVLTTTGEPTHVAFRGLLSDLGEALESTGDIPIWTAPMTPDADGSVVDGVEETFGAAVGAPWVLLTGTSSNSVPAGFRVRDGYLTLRGAAGPSQYLALLGTYDRTNQDILVRIRANQLGTAPAGPAAAISMRSSVGGGERFGGLECGSPVFFNSGGYGGLVRTGGDPTGPAASWRRVDRNGAAILPPSTDWYWLRLQHRAEENGDQGRIRAKIWTADGSIPEPSQWEEWTYPTREGGPLTGLAGLVAPTGEIGEFLVDYVLVQAAGLPRITVRTDGLRAPEWVRQPSDYWTVPGGAARPLGFATGDSPLSYRWFLGSTLVASNQTGSLLFRPINEDTGPFRLVVSNAYGSITSAPVTARVGYSPNYSSTFGNRDSAADWTGARWVSIPDSGLLVPSGAGPMRVRLPRIAAGQEVTVRAGIQVAPYTVLDWSISRPGGRPYFRTRFNTIPPSPRVQGPTDFQSFPAPLGEALVPAFTDYNGWGYANARMAIDTSGSQSARPDRRPFLVGNPQEGTGRPLFIERSFVATEDLDGLEFGSGEGWSMMNLNVTIRSPETPRIRFEKEVYRAEEGAGVLEASVVRDGFLEGTLTVNARSETVTGATNGFQSVTNRLVFGPGVRRAIVRVPLVGTPPDGEPIRFRMRLVDPEGFDLVDIENGTLAIGIAEASREEVRLEPAEGDILSEGRGALWFKVPSTGGATNPPRGIEVRLDPLDAGTEAEPRFVTVTHGGLDGRDSITGLVDGYGTLVLPDDLTASANRRWKASFTGASHGLKPSGEPLTLLVVDNDTAGFQTFLPRNLGSLSPDGDGGAYLLSGLFSGTRSEIQDPGIVHMSRDGRLDTRFTFAPEARLVVLDGMARVSDGGFLVLQMRIPGPRPGLTRHNATGLPDPGFTNAPGATHDAFQQVLLGLGDNTGLVVARLARPDGLDELWRVDATGAVQEDLRRGVGGIEGRVLQIQRLSAEEVVLAGEFISVGGRRISKLAKVRLSDGHTTSMEEVLATGASDEFYRLISSVEGGGLWIEGRGRNTVRFLRLRPDGTPDPGFGMAQRTVDSQLYNLPLVDGTGRIHWFEGNRLRATGPDGLDVPAYHSPTVDGLGQLSLSLLGDGSLLLAGRFGSVDGVSRSGLARISSDGRLLPWPDEPMWPGEVAELRDVTALTGQVAVLRATVATNGTESLQWQRDGLSVPGATNRILETRGPGTYRLVAIGGGVVRTSRSATVRFLEPSEVPRFRLADSAEGPGRRGVVSAPPGITTRIEVSEDLRTWIPAEPADLDGSAVRLDRFDRPRRYFRVVVE